MSMLQRLQRKSNYKEMRWYVNIYAGYKDIYIFTKNYFFKKERVTRKIL